MKLHNFFRSGTSHRVRIALHLKGVPVDYVPVDLRTDQHTGAAYRAINPQQVVPALELDGGGVLIQSPAIIEWLEETVPTPALLPADLTARARVRALAAIVGCDIHPVNNRRVLEQLRHEFGASEDAVRAWCAKWIVAGFDAIEALLGEDTTRGGYCWGGVPTLADVYLIPQVESARRFGVDLARWPRIMDVDATCAQLPAFQRAAPARQPDA